MADTEKEVDKILLGGGGHTWQRREIMKLIAKEREQAAVEGLRNELQQAAIQMTEQPLEQLEESERWEWYGYLRALRDIAYFASVLNGTDIQQRLGTRLAQLQSTQSPREEK